MKEKISLFLGNFIPPHSAAGRAANSPFVASHGCAASPRLTKPASPSGQGLSGVASVSSWSCGRSFWKQCVFSCSRRNPVLVRASHEATTEDRRWRFGSRARPAGVGRVGPRRPNGFRFSPGSTVTVWCATRTRAGAAGGRWRGGKRAPVGSVRGRAGSRTWGLVRNRSAETATADATRLDPLRTFVSVWP